MTTVLYDSTTAADIPTTATAAAGYVDGNFAWSLSDWRRFPDVPHITITIAGQGGARVLDWESGNPNPSSWAAAEIKAGRRPTIYTSKANVAAVAAAIAPLRFGVDVDLWDADWTGVAHLNPGSVATQYADPVTSGGHYDLSLAADTWLTPPPPIPAPIPPPPLPKEADVASPLHVVDNANNEAVEVVYIGSDGHTIQCVYVVGTGWVVYDLTDLAKFPVACTT